MKKMFRNAVIALGLGATALTAAASAQARDVRYRGHDDAGVAVAAGLAGLAVGAAIASSGDRYRDDGYYYETYDYPGYYARPAYYGYYGYPRSYSYAYAYPRGGYRYYDHGYTTVATMAAAIIMAAAPIMGAAAMAATAIAAAEPRA